MNIFLISDKLMENMAKFVWSALTNLNIGKTVTEALGSDISTVAGQVATGVKQFALNLQTPLQGIGIAIATAFFIVQLLELTTQERFTLEFFIKFFGKLAVAIGLILVCKSLTENIWGFGNAFTNTIEMNYKTASAKAFGGKSSDALDAKVRPSSGVSKDEQEFIDNVKTQFKDTNTIGFILQFGIVGLVIYLMSLILIIVVYVVSFTRLLEMAVRAIFMPVAFALLADDGWRGAGGRYIKKFIAICCQGAVMILIGEAASFAILTSLNAMSNASDFLMAIVIDLGIAYAGVSMMLRSIGIINDVFGA